MATPAATGHATASTHPSAVTTGVSVAILTTLPTYTVVPTTVVFQVSVVNSTISTDNTTIWLNITDATTSTLCTSNNISSLVSDTSMGTVNYWLTVDSTFFTGYATACPGFLGDGGSMSIAVIQGGPNGTASAEADEGTSFVIVTPSSLLHVLPTASAHTYSIYANYTAQYTGKVQLTIYNPAGAVVLSASLARNGSQVTTVSWTETITGVYPYTLSVYTAYDTTGFNTTGSINVLPTTNVYTNTSSWSNSSLIPGLSSGASGTILLVVGLLIGMIVAMVVGRMVWGGPKTVAPAQPWDSKTAGTNTCSTCGRSFATPEELAEHGKSEHGLQ